MSNMKIYVVLLVISSGCVCLSSVTVPSSRLEVELGQPVVLQCEYDASGVEYIRVTWYEVFGFKEDGQPDLELSADGFVDPMPMWRTDTYLRQNISLNGYDCNFVYKGPLSENHAIRITPSQFKPLLAYGCVVIDAFGGSPIGAAGINVTLLVAPSPVIRQSSVQYIEDKPGTIHCDVHSVKPAAGVTMWMELDGVRYDGSVTSTKHQNTTSFLSLTSTIPSIPWDVAGKELWCRVEWRGKDYTASAPFSQVKYAPKKNAGRIQRHPSIDQSVLLNVSFWSFPSPSSVSWSAPNGPADSTWNGLGRNMYQSVLTVSLTLANNFGTYQYEITNEIGSLVGNITLETTKPDKPLNASITRQTAHSLLVFWAPGYSGGSLQTFTVSYKTQGQTSWQIHQELIPDPGAGNLASNVISELSPDVLYELQIVAVNVNGTSDPLLMAGRTRVLPIPPEDLQITQTENQAQISWTDMSKDYDSVVMRQCQVDTDACINHTLTADHNGLVVTTEPGITYTLTLLFYQHDQLVITSRQFTCTSPVDSRDNITSLEGGISGAVAVIIIVAVVIFIIFMIRYKRKKSNWEGAYQNEATVVYESNIASDVRTANSNYASITTSETQDTNSGVYEQVHILEAISPSCLTLSSVIHNGLYSKTMNGVVRGVAHLDHMDVIAKVVNKNCLPGKMLLKDEIEAVRKIQYHPNLSVYVGYNITSEDPVFLLSEPASQGNLSSYLMTSQKTGVRLPHTELLHFADGLIKGLRHLHGQKSSMVMHCVCCAHVLLSHNLQCRLTGFTGITDVTMRHQYAASVKYTQHDRWLAPETLNNQVHDEKSDIWSLGATLYEIFTQGDIPFAKYPDSAVKAHIIQGKSLTRTDAIAPDVFSVIDQCMCMTPSSRATLDNIAVNLSFANST